MKKKPYIASVNELINYYNTDINNGLTESDVEERLKKHGPNTLPDSKTKSFFSIFLSQFKSPLIYVLLLAAIIAFFLGESRADAYIIVIILTFNAIIGSFLEGRAQNILTSLRKFLSNETQVIRNSDKSRNKNTIIKIENLVPGDIILLAEGDNVPADARIIQANNLKVDESILTGESRAIKKTDENIDKEKEIHDQKNMLFKGTSILSGSGKALVVSTGLATQIGKIHKSISDITSEVPLQNQINKLSNWLIAIAAISCLIIFIAGIYLNQSFTSLLYTIITLFVSAIPEGLPIVVTIVLARGAYQMAKQNMLVKKLPAAEGLGRTDIILLDKTGTLTKNEMTVLKAYSDNKVFTVTGIGYAPKGNILFQEEPISINNNITLELLKDASILLNKSNVQYNEKAKVYNIKGEPLEAAMGVFGEKISNSKDNTKEEYKEVFEIPFDADLRMHIAGFTQEQDPNIYIFSAGAPEYIIKSCYFEQDNQQIKKTLQEFLEEGLRVIALAYIKVPLKDLENINNYKDYISTNLIGKFSFLGLLGIQDSIRENLEPVIEKARESGLKIIMLTGDHKKTAEYVAKETGIISTKAQNKLNSYDFPIIEGSELEKLTDKELTKLLETTTVFARVTPHNKLRIVNLLKDQGNIVAMTGDGVNDAPSLVAASLGIAMGITGTEVTKKAADLVLLDDSLESIISAIEQGRHIFYTLRRVILYLLATNLGEILVILSSVFLSLPLPLMPIQILWLNLVTDGFLDIALIFEPKEPGLLKKHWLKKSQGSRIMDINLFIKIIYMAIPMAIGTIILFLLYLENNDYDKARTIALCTMASFQWINAWNCRSETISIFNKKFFNNIWLILATILVICLQLLAVYVPFMQKYFYTTNLALKDWAIVVLVSSSIFILEELRKYIYSFIKRES